MPIKLSCEVCGSDFTVPPSRKETAKTCSHACAVSFRAEARKRRSTLNCKQCGRAFEVPTCHVARRVYCSSTCREANPEIKAAKTARTGEKNAYWRGGVSMRHDGYRYALARWHPYASPSGYVLEHRLVMERWLLQNDPASRFLTYTDGHLVLSPKFEVHHKDENRVNNDISNLECLTPSEHKALHNKRKREGWSK